MAENKEYANNRNDTIPLTTCNPEDTEYPVVLTIAGSDSGGGAGIEADIKTFASLGVHGACAITSVTSQNTTGVLDAYELPAEVVTSQINAVCKDMDINWTKTGMLSSAGIIRCVAQNIRDHSFSVVVDPVMAAEAGGDLMEKSALEILKEELLPVSFAVTPNIAEAEALSGLEISTKEEAKEAAIRISKLGVKNIIVTGGHLDATDILYESQTDRFTLIPGHFIKGGTHGSGCTYSSALTAFLARGHSLPDAAKAAKHFVEKAIAASKNIGKGVAPVNQMGYLNSLSIKEEVMKDTRQAVDMLRHCQPFADLIAEVGCNIAMALPAAVSEKDVTGVEGRMVKLNGEPHIVGCISFGASSHIARIVLATMQFDPSRRAAMNIKYSEKLLDICREMGLSISSFDRAQEPENTKTMDWGVTHAIKTRRSVPDVIYDKGGVGKEPMIRILGNKATDVVRIVIDIATYEEI